MQGAAPLLAAAILLLLSPDSKKSDDYALDTKAILHACESSGEPPFKENKLGSVSKSDFIRARDVLFRDRTVRIIEDRRIKESVCIVALWQASHKPALDGKRNGVPTIQISDSDVENRKSGSPLMDGVLRQEILTLEKQLEEQNTQSKALSKSVKEGQETQSRVYRICLILSVLAVILASLAGLYSRSATRKTLRAAGLL